MIASSGSCAFSSPNMSQIARRLCGSRPVVGSSRKRTRGRMQDAARDLEAPAHAAREVARDLVAPLPEADLVAGGARSARAACAPTGRTSFPGSRGSPARSGSRRSSAPGRRCRSTAARRSGGRRRRGPRCGRVPEVGGRSVVSIRMSVVLPAPLGPSRPYTSPAFTENDTASSATKSPKRLVSRSTSMGRGELTLSEARCPLRRRRSGPRPRIRRAAGAAPRTSAGRGSGGPSSCASRIPSAA